MMRRRRLIRGLIRGHLLGLALLAGTLGACAPTVQSADIPAPGFAGPRLEADAVVASDGARLGLTVWEPAPDAPVRGVIVALHGMNDYARAWQLAGPWWAREAGIITYAYDARGFGRSPGRGIWAGQAPMTADLRTVLALVRQRHPGVPVAVAGESMGAATILAALGEPQGLEGADRIALLAPAVWGWSNLPPAYSASLWLGAHLAGSRAVEPPRAVVRRIRPTDNEALLRDLGRDRMMLFETRIDAVYGLVRLMEAGFRATARLPQGSVVLVGARDAVVPPAATAAMIARLPPGVRLVRYPDGYHMLTRDLQAARVFADVAAALLAPDTPLPSGLEVALPGSLAQNPVATSR
jgi:acylglycerol lipase